MYSKNLKLFFSLLIMCVAPAFMAGAMPLISEDVPDEVAPAEEITPDSLLERAMDAFKNVTFLKFEGEPLDVVSPVAYEAAGQIMDVLPMLEKDSRPFNKAREALRELDRDMLSGAYFYSNAGNQTELTRFAQRYLDIQLMPAFEGYNWETDAATQAMIAYIAASGAYNAQDFEKAVDYFKAYLATGDDKHRQAVYLFMSQACLKSQNYDLGIPTASEGLKYYPGEKQLMLIGMQMCIDGGRGEKLQEFLSQALTLNPTDEKLLNIQGQLYEDEGQYEQALNIYNTLDELKPNMLATTKHIGLCYYNMAVDYFNKAINQSDDKVAARNRRQAKNYFAAAADKFRDVLASAPTSVPYLRSLGVCYLCLEDKYNFEKINEKLILLDADPLSNVFMPPTMTYEGAGQPNIARQSGNAMADAPAYSKFAGDYITSRLEKWVTKGEFERMEDYTARVNDKTILAEYNKLNAEAADEYLKTYANKLRLNDLRLEPYDATNEVFKINSSYGPMYLNVPLKNNEAETFKESFSGIRFQNPSYFIDNDSVRIAAITFIAANGKQYTYDNARAHNYSNPDVYIDFASIINAGRPKAAASASNSPVVIAAKSDVDENIPVGKKRADNKLALIIANENYKHVQNVPAALADGQTFAEYCRTTLGIPATNVSVYTDASYAELLDAVSDLQRKADVLGSDAEIIVYYAGHGLPDENTKDAYILSTDANPTNPRTWYKLGDLYSTLAGMNASDVMVFIDACFSGAERDGGMLAAASGARAVAIRAKEAAPKGNMFVLTAASGNETALPYKEKNHGMFTYYLLKKIQDTKGNVTLQDLSDYVIENVRRQSNFVNQKPQTPTVTTSGRMATDYKTKKLVQ